MTDNNELDLDLTPERREAIIRQLTWVFSSFSKSGSGSDANARERRAFVAREDDDWQQRHQRIREQLRKLEESIAARTGEIDLESKHALDEQVLALLELGKLLAWVESLPQETVVGYAGQATACPVYRYLKDVGMRVSFVTPGSVLGNDFALQGEKLPKAISWLICAIDATKEKDSRERSVTAGELAKLISDVLLHQQ